MNRAIARALIVVSLADARGLASSAGELISRSLGTDLGVLFAARRVGNRLDVRACIETSYGRGEVRRPFGTVVELIRDALTERKRCDI